MKLRGLFASEQKTGRVILEALTDVAQIGECLAQFLQCRLQFAKTLQALVQRNLILRQQLLQAGAAALQRSQAQLQLLQAGGAILLKQSIAGGEQLVGLLQRPAGQLGEMVALPRQAAAGSLKAGQQLAEVCRILGRKQQVGVGQQLTDLEQQV